MKSGGSQPLQSLLTSTQEVHGPVFPDKLPMTKERTSLEASGSSRRRRNQMKLSDTSPELSPRDTCRYQEWITLRDIHLLPVILLLELSSWLAYTMDGWWRPLTLKLPF